MTALNNQPPLFSNAPHIDGTWKFNISLALSSNLSQDVPTFPTVQQQKLIYQWQNHIWLNIFSFSFCLSVDLLRWSSWKRCFQEPSEFFRRALGFCCCSNGTMKIIPTQCANRMKHPHLCFFSLSIRKSLSIIQNFFHCMIHHTCWNALGIISSRKILKMIMTITSKREQ